MVTPSGVLPETAPPSRALSQTKRDGTMPQLCITTGTCTRAGRKTVNQDFDDIWIPDEPLLSLKGVAVALADGISSSPVSQIAAKVAVTSFLSDYFSTPEPWSVKKSAQRVLGATNSWLYAQTRQSQNPYDREKGYVCTFSGAVFRSRTAHLFHLGDARIYRLRGTEMEQLTEDHRLWISSEQSYLSRALGMDSQAAVDYHSTAIETGDIFLFMTDGVYEKIYTRDMVRTLRQHGDDLDAAARTLVQIAYENGSGDNLTARIVRIDTLPPLHKEEIRLHLDEKPLPPPLEARMVFDGYRIVRTLSRSTRSHVHLAVDLETGSSVVLKTPSMEMQNDRDYLERFLMEEWIARRIDNAFVLKAYPQNRSRCCLYTVFEYVEGQTLAQWMIDNPCPELETVRDFAEQIARGLLAFHRLEMLHQDLRPENVMIDRTGSLKLIDFGSVNVRGVADVEAFPAQLPLAGTLQYSAPEYFLGESGTDRSDLYSLAAIVYQMLSNRLPYGTRVAKATTRGAQRKLSYLPLPANETRTIPPWIDETLKKALQPDPYKRYEELSEFIYELRRPNPAYLNRTRPPIFERHPVLFWKSVSLLLSLILLFLLVH